MFYLMLALMLAVQFFSNGFRPRLIFHTAYIQYKKSKFSSTGAHISVYRLQEDVTEATITTTRSSYYCKTAWIGAL